MVLIHNVTDNHTCFQKMAAFALLMVLCSPFMPFAINDNYFRLYPLSFGIVAVCVLSVWGTLSRGQCIVGRFRFADILIISGVVYYLFRYDYASHLADWKIMYAFLLLLLWLAVRIVIAIFPTVKIALPIGVAVLGCLLGLWGVAQLYGWATPGHAYFCITGPFFNPGPYAGYFSVKIPVVDKRVIIMDRECSFMSTLRGPLKDVLYISIVQSMVLFIILLKKP